MADEAMTDDVSRNERIKEASAYLRGTLAEGLSEESTGAIAEDDQQLVKFHGMYLQDDRDLRPERTRKKMEKAFAFMIRVRIPGGVLTSRQWLGGAQTPRAYRRGADVAAMAGARSSRARLRQRHHAADHPSDRSIARRHQVEPENDAARHRRRSSRFPP